MSFTRNPLITGLKARYSFIVKSRIFILSFILSCLAAPSFAQVNSSQLEQGREILDQRNISEDEVKKRLLERGIDLDNLRPDQVAGLQNEIEEVIAEIEAEQRAMSDSTSSAKGIQEEIADTTAPSQDKVNKEVVERKYIPAREKSIDSVNMDNPLAEEMTKTFHDQYRFSNRVFGHDIFFNKTIGLYQTTKNAATPDNYVLDAGDKLIVNIFGVSQADLVYEIDEEGFISPSNMYKIYLKGVTVGKAKALLRSRFRSAYRFTDEQFNLELHTARTITVNIFGEVEQQGSYTISALNTAINALIAAGGPTADGGIRQIEIMSGGKKRILDIYEFIRNPSVQYDYYLKDNDLIYVPKAGKRVSANGSGFRKSAVYELKDGENFNKLVELAGGLKPSVYRELVQHISMAEEEQSIRDYTFDEASEQDIALLDGDIVIIRTSSLRYKNYVQVSGSVRHQGKFELKDNMRLADVLEKAVVEEETYAKIAFLRRSNPDGTFKMIRLYPLEALEDKSSGANILLEKEDLISIYTKRSFTDSYNFSVQGAVRQPSKYQWDPDKNITLYDALVMSKGLRPDALPFGYIISTPTDNPIGRTYKMIEPSAAYNDPSSPANIQIHANDIIIIPSMASYSDQFHVEVSGAVRKPGKYIFDPSLNFYDLITMAGGLKLEAASNKIDVFRLQINENEPTYTYAQSIEIDRDYDPLNSPSPIELQPFDHVVVRHTPEFDPIKYVTITGEVKYPGLYAVMDSNERIRSLIKRAGGLTNEAFPKAATLVREEDSLGVIVTRVDKLMKRRKSPYNITIQEGDHLHIPKLVDVVKIDKKGTNAEELYVDNDLIGEQLKTVVHFKKHKRAGWYVRKFAGGFDQTAKKGKTYVLHPNGEIKKTFSLFFIHFYPKVREGSEIRTTLKKKHQEDESGGEFISPDTKKKDKSDVDVMQKTTQLLAVLSTVMATTSSAVSTVILIRQL